MLHDWLIDGAIFKMNLVDYTWLAHRWRWKTEHNVNYMLYVCSRSTHFDFFLIFTTSATNMWVQQYFYQWQQISLTLRILCGDILRIKNWKCNTFGYLFHSIHFSRLFSRILIIIHIYIGQPWQHFAFFLEYLLILNC